MGGGGGIPGVQACFWFNESLPKLILRTLLCKWGAGVGGPKPPRLFEGAQACFKTIRIPSKPIMRAPCLHCFFLGGGGLLPQGLLDVVRFRTCGTAEEPAEAENQQNSPTKTRKIHRKKIQPEEEDRQNQRACSENQKKSKEKQTKITKTNQKN